MKTRSFPWTIIAAAAVAGAGFAGVANYVRTESEKPRALTEGELNANVAANPDPNKIKGDNDGKSGDQTNRDGTVKRSKVDALNTALKDGNLARLRVLDVTVEENGNALVDMTQEIRKGFGSEEEAFFIKTLTDTLARFEDVKTFQIRIEGEIQKSLSHFEMIDPIPVR